MIVAALVHMTSPESLGLPSPIPSAIAGAFSGGIEVVDLGAETNRIDSDGDPQRSARTLVRLGTLRLTLISLQAGAKLKEHHTNHELSIQTVSGCVSIHTPHERVNLTQGCVAVLERGLLHDIQAHEASAILVTTSGSSTEQPRTREPDQPVAKD
jgi:quercetin dioxygenase-like cupin family protein